MENVRVIFRFLILTIYFGVHALINPLSAQVKTYVGIETTVAKDFYDYSDLYESTGYDGVGLKLKPLPSYAFGLNCGWRLNNNFSIETGFLVKHYTIAFGFNTERNKESRISESFGLLYRFPVRFRYQFDMIKDKLYFLPCVGISAAFDGYAASHLRIGSGALLDVYESSYDYYYTINTLNGTLVNPFWFLEGSVGFGVPIGRTLISAQASFVKGLNKVHAGFFTYNSDPANIVQRLGTLTGSGDYMGVTLNVVYQIKK